jgi:hypothetical protein
MYLGSVKHPTSPAPDLLLDVTIRLGESWAQIPSLISRAGLPGGGAELLLSGPQLRVTSFVGRLRAFGLWCDATGLGWEKPKRSSSQLVQAPNPKRQLRFAFAGMGRDGSSKSP